MPVSLHHPPYTNSTLTSDEIHVQRFFVPAFQGAVKTLAMLSDLVVPWTVNDEDRMKELADFAVDGILTDDATRLRRTLGEPNRKFAIPRKTGYS